LAVPPKPVFGCVGTTVGFVLGGEVGCGGAVVGTAVAVGFLGFGVFVGAGGIGVDVAVGGTAVAVLVGDAGGGGGVTGVGITDGGGGGGVPADAKVCTGL
jgi:hypothetical protein